MAQRELAEHNEARAVAQQERAEQNLQQSLLSSADVALGRGKDADAMQLSLAAMGISQSEKARGRGQATIAVNDLGGGSFDISNSRRKVGAVMTWISRSASATPAASQMPSKRRRTMCSASSAA